MDRAHPIINDNDASSSGENITTKYEISEAQTMLLKFWPTVCVNLKNQNTELPLARIKKIMKLDEDVKMISAEAPVLFSKAAEIFISELALRSWVHTEENKRRTLQKNDIAMAVSKFDQFDFLIDIVPRDEIKPVKRDDIITTGVDGLQYYLQVSDNNQVSTINTASKSNMSQVSIIQAHEPTTNIIQAGSQRIRSSQIINPSLSVSSTPSIEAVNLQSQAEVISSPGTQVYQQIIDENGEVQNIPIQLTQEQLESISSQLAGKTIGQSTSIVIETPTDP